MKPNNKQNHVWIKHILPVLVISMMITQATPSTAYAYPFEEEVNYVIDTVKGWFSSDSSEADSGSGYAESSTATSSSSSSYDSSESESTDYSGGAYQEVAEQIAMQLNSTGTLPEGTVISGRVQKTNEKTGERETFVAITSEQKESFINNVVLEIDEDGLVKAASEVNLSGSGKEYEEIYQDILKNNDLSAEETEELNSTLHKRFDEASISIADTLGISPETAAGTAAGLISSAGLLILGAGKSEGELEELYGDVKETIEEEGDGYKTKATKALENSGKVVPTPSNFSDEDTSKKSDSNSSSNSSGGEGKRFTRANHAWTESSVNPSAYDFSTISASIESMKDMSKITDKHQTKTIASFIQSCNPDWKGEELRKLASNICYKAKLYNIDPLLITAQIQAESNFNPNITSSVGAMGMCQFMPETAKGYGINPLNVEQAIDAMCQYIQSGMKTYGDYSLALAAYNAGGGNVEKYGGIPPFSETKGYISKIQNTYANLVSNVKLLASTS